MNALLRGRTPLFDFRADELNCLDWIVSLLVETTFLYGGRSIVSAKCSSIYKVVDDARTTAAFIPAVFDG